MGDSPAGQSCEKHLEQVLTLVVLVELQFVVFQPSDCLDLYSEQRFDLAGV